MISRPKDNKEITIQEVESFPQHAISCAEELRSAASCLPAVDQDGNSECPNAKELYEKKEKAQKNVENCLERLHEYAEWTREQIDRLRNNLVVISANADRLNSDLPRHEFSEAEVKLAAIYKRLIRLQLKIKKTIKLCHEAIRYASEKKHPSTGDEEESMLADVQDSPEDETSDEEMDEFLHKMLMMGPIE